MPTPASDKMTPGTPQDAEKAIPQSLPSATDWNGPDDPENPLNWPAWRRHYQVIPPAFISFAAYVQLPFLPLQHSNIPDSTLGSSIYSPAFPAIQEKFNVSPTVALLPLSLYVIALGFGPLLAAPLSEVFGRHIVYLATAPLGALFTMGAGFSQNIQTLCILRFFAGMSFSPCLAIGAGTIADVNLPENRAYPTTLYIMAPFLGPALG